MPLGEGIGLAVAVGLALGLISLLVSAQMTAANIGPARRRQALLSLWLVVLGLIALLFALRALTGGPVIGGSPSTGLWLGHQPRQIAALVVAAVLLVVGFVRLHSILAGAMPRPSIPDRPPPEETP